MATVKQGIKRKFKAKNKKAKYKISYKYASNQTLKDDKLTYSSAYSTKVSNLKYKE